jgi:hypothetical protein
MINSENATWWLFGFIIAVVVIVVPILLSFKIKNKKEVKTEVKTGVKVEPPRPTKRKAIMSYTLINNKTDKEYIVSSENDFGLSWEFFGNDVSKYEVLQIRQEHSINKSVKWTTIGVFFDFSVTSTVWKEFDIVYDDDKKEEVK